MRTIPSRAGDARHATPPGGTASAGAPRRAAWLAVSMTALCVLGIACATIAWRHAAGGGAAAPAPAVASVVPADALPMDGPMPIDLYRFALNALLVPLLDDAEPLRWTDAALDLDCGPGTRVLVDDAPLVPGAPVPAGAFTVRWLIDWCRPLGVASVELSGVVDLQGHRVADGLHARVTSERLVVSSVMGSTRLRGVFAAAMSMAPPATPPH